MVLFLGAKLAIPGTGLTYFGAPISLHFHDRDLLDVAHGDEHRRRRARHSAGLPQRGESAEALEDQDALQGAVPATLPYMFTGFRLSLGIAWLVIVAAEMLTGKPGRRRLSLAAIQRLSYAHIILCILTIGVVGFVLDRLMSVVEALQNRLRS